MQLNNFHSQLLRYLWRWRENMPPPLRYLGLIEGYLICWAILDQIALLFETVPEVSVWYPPSGLDFTLLLVFGLRFIPAIALNTYVHDLIVPGRNMSLVTLTLTNLITTIGYAGACAFLLLKLRINPRLRTLRDVIWFVVIATILAPLCVATLQTLNLAWSGITPWKGWLIHVLHYWAGEATGIAMLTPLLLVILRPLTWLWAYSEPEAPPSEPKLISSKNKRRQLLIEIIFLSAAIWAAYGAKRGPNLDYSYFVFVPMIWIATRHGFERATATVLFINIGVALLQRTQISGANVFALQFGMMAISLTGMLLGGFATQRMQAEQELHYAANRLKTLHELDQAILAAHSLFEIAEAALARIVDLIPCQTASMVMFDMEKREFIVLAVNPTSTEIEPGARFPVAAYGEFERLANGELITVQETLTFGELPAITSQLLGENVRAYLKVPLLAQSELIGALNLAKDTPGAFQARIVEFAQQVANTVAIAIQQARLFSQVQQQATEARSLNQISQAINSTLNPQQVLQQIVQLTGECFNVDRVLIFSVTNEQVRILSRWQANDQISAVSLATADLSTPAASDLIQITQTPDTSMLSVPIFIREQMFGCIALQTATKRVFTDDEINLLQAVASQAAIALYNAQSYENLEELVRQRTQELEHEKLLSDAANRAKSDFLSNMSHELRTPLTGILGFSSILSEQIFGELNPKQQQYVELIHTSGKHLLELINDLLDLTKIEAGKEELALETIIVEEVANACMILIQERAHRRGLQLSLSIAPNVTTCVADKRRIKQILVNLLSNAVKFTETGSVTLQIEQTETEIKFSVIDTGIGISPEEQATLFQPFQQLDSGLNRKYEGTGLGLALSRRLAQLHDGDITLESEAGRGSCFTLHLPI